MNQPSPHPQVPKKPFETPGEIPSPPQSLGGGHQPPQEIVRQTRSAVEQSGSSGQREEKTPVAGESLLPHQRKSSERVTVYRAKPEAPNENPSSEPNPSENPEERREPVRTDTPTSEEEPIMIEGADQSETPRDAQLEEINNIILDSDLDDATKAQLGAKVTELSQEKRQLILDLSRKQGERKLVEKKRKRDLSVFSAVALLLMFTGIGSSAYFAKRNIVNLTNADGKGINPIPLQVNNPTPERGMPLIHPQSPEQQLASGNGEKNQQEQPVDKNEPQDQPSPPQQLDPNISTEQTPESWTTIPSLPETPLERNLSKSAVEGNRWVSTMNPEVGQLLKKAHEGKVLNELEIETIRGYRDIQISQLRAQLRTIEDQKRNKLDRMINESRAQMNRTFSEERAQLEQQLGSEEREAEKRFRVLQAELERAIGERRRELDSRVNTLRNSTDTLIDQSRNAQQSDSF